MDNLGTRPKNPKKLRLGPQISLYLPRFLLQRCRLQRFKKIKIWSLVEKKVVLDGFYIQLFGLKRFFVKFQFLLLQRQSKNKNLELGQKKVVLDCFYIQLFGLKRFFLKFQFLLCLKSDFVHFKNIFFLALQPTALKIFQRCSLQR